ncbi:MAG TPA: zinc-binding alcohol dehydrogenase [Armatimonadota bacterium]|nr:zinc-binding alcohol dehydrogenase [Armatimonadota bacterium]
MKQVFIDGSGQIVVREVEAPELGENGILSKTAYSVISTGTETMGIRARRKNPDPSRPDGHSGYTNSGVVTAVGANVEGIEVGDQVGNYGSPSAFGGHAEVCCIGKHLAIKLPENVSLKEAAFTGLGGIAMQAVRRSQLTFGEHVLVMGLGVLGQIIARICHAAAYQGMASDFLEDRLKLARDAGIRAVNASDDVVAAVMDATDGRGADAVLISVATDSAEPITQALKAIRFGGRIVIVGVTKMEVDRSLFFAKEADFVISRAAGPGRYDPSYEGEGNDYPYPYVRWTEGRNLREFIRLLSEKRLRVDDLISHEFPVEQAADAYEQALDRPQETLGVLLKYSTME